ncbi:MAG: carbon-nitrogen hydrolase family protein [Bryobacteraceae bacterium]|nr:carbon-nitrogen hydrolase family protein [Bryobacteraceae bacterium]
MIQKPFIIAAAQVSSNGCILAENVTHHVRVAELAAENNVGLLVFPELSLTGYDLRLARASALTVDSPLLDPLRRFPFTLAVGAPVRHPSGAHHIAAIVFRPAGVSVHSKVNVHETELPYFDAGAGGDPIDVNGVRVALAICRDARQPQHAAQAAAMGARVYAAGVMVDQADYAAKIVALAESARRHRMAALMANACGGVAVGKSAFWDEDGQTVVAADDDAECLVIASQVEGRWQGKVVPLT